MNPIFYIDFYKVGHIDQYPSGIDQIWTNWTARKSRVEGVTEVDVLGQQMFCKKLLQQEFDTHFFLRPWEEIRESYREVISATLGIKNPRTDHLQALHEVGYLPIKIYSLPEGTHCPIGVPSMVVTNTDPRFFWLPNYIETMLSASLWKPATSSTTARQYRQICEKYAREAGEKDFSFIDWQCHDFSYRGMSGVEDAILSGLGHLVYFSGTDTLPAILAANRYYSAGLSCGGSVPATEHSVMCAGEKDGELETFRRLICDVYPKGIVSIVSDTWDLWKVLTEYVPSLKDKILARDGKIVIRPDSGDPVLIMTGDHITEIKNSPPYKGVLQLLAEGLGITNGKGFYPMIHKAGAIYGDSITPLRAEQILKRTINQCKLSPYNVVFGVGSYTYEYVTRDTFGFAMKATAIRRGREIIPIFKKPITDSGEKFSCKGIPSVWTSEVDGKLYLQQESTPQDLEDCEYRKIFEDGKLLVEETWTTIRGRARG